MKTLGFDQPLYILPFDHRGSFQTKLFGWTGTLTDDQTAQIAASKQVIYDGFRAAIRAGVPADKAGRKSSNFNTAKISLHTLRRSGRPSARFWFATTWKATRR
jgi:hypothetical protein